MLNQVVIVGRLCQIDRLIDDSEKRGVIFKLIVPRSYKNANGEHENDFIPVRAFGLLSDEIRHNCKDGDLLGVKGRIETIGDRIIIVAEKITFLSSKQTN